MKRSRRKLVLRILVVVSLGVLVSAGLGLVWQSWTAPRRPVVSPVVPGGTRFFVVSRAHTSGHVVYQQMPPVGGPHSPTWLNCGIYDSVVPTEQAVHSLEHGAVWITYNPAELQPRALSFLKSFVRKHSFGPERWILLSPLPELPSRLAASAWGAQLLFDDPADPRLGQFIAHFAGSPSVPEPSVGCTHGAGAPL